MDVVVVLLLENLGANNKVRNAGIVVCLKKKIEISVSKIRCQKSICVDESEFMSLSFPFFLRRILN